MEHIPGSGWTPIPSTITTSKCMWMDGYADDGPIGANGWPAMPMDCKDKATWMTCGGKPEKVVATVCRPRTYCTRHAGILKNRSKKAGCVRGVDTHAKVGHNDT